MTASGVRWPMQEYLDGSNKNEPKDAKSPGKDNGIRAYATP
jgi:hypothetical protein